ncbi:DUF84 family protein, partial [Candidatus Parcubacteria bacterium]|nr:DUF84 family protein [Candidatus Parcubacteria bacterium]
ACFSGETFDFVPRKCDSGVSSQPIGFEETKFGARNRLKAIRESDPNADYWISLEGGLEERMNAPPWRGYFSFAIILVTSNKIPDFVGIGESGRYKVPRPIEQIIRGQKLGLGGAANQFFKSLDLKGHRGAIGEMTDGAISRADMYLFAAITALSQTKHPEWYA